MPHRLGAFETEMSTARIGHRAVRGPVDYRRFNINYETVYCASVKFKKSATN